MKLFAILVLLSVAATSAQAKCPAKSPSTKGMYSVQKGDKRVNAAWLTKTLAGKTVKFDDGTESYSRNGSYAYKAGGQTWKAPSYRFYDNGLRCIDYPKPRFDMYVVNKGKLVLINSSGDRYIGKIYK